MSLSRREQVLGATTLMAVLFGALGLTARERIERWRTNAERVETLRRQRAVERELIAMAPLWRERYGTVRDQMPVFEPGRQVDTYWLSRMDALADEYGVRIIRRQVGREEQVGDVFEFPIECREWEGTLDAFVRFLYALQSEGAMLDVRDLLVRPHPSAAGLLRGSFTLYCAYMRGVAAPEPAPAPAGHDDNAPPPPAAGSESALPADDEAGAAPLPGPSADEEGEAP